jgi:uncharacterized membrane protein YphA (DoxX/SURF4 family)
MSQRSGWFRRMDDAGWPQGVARLVLALVMIRFAWPKIVDPLDFLKVLRNYHIIPEEPAIYLNLIALCLPWIELVGSLLILIGLWRRAASALFALLLTSFTVAVLYRAMHMYGEVGGAFCDIKFDCGCGMGEVYICTKLLENLGLILLSVYLIISRSNRFGLDAAIKPKSK